MKKEYSGKAFTSIEQGNGAVQGVLFEDCLFQHCKFQNLSIENCLFSGCRFENSFFSGLSFRGTSALNNSFQDCSLSGINWSDLLEERKREMGFLPFDALAGCAVRHSVFYRLNLKRADFTGCDFSGSYFDECNLSEAVFREANLQKASFSQNDLSAADFRGASGYLFSLENNRVRKAKFSLPEAINLLAAFDVEIEGL